MLDKIFLFGVGVTNGSKDAILEYLIKNIEKSSKKIFVATPNPEMIVFANKNPDFKNILNSADLALCDGIGLMIASKVMGKPLRERITGVDFVKSVCERVSKSNLADAKKPITVGFLGGGHGVAVKTAECLVREYPGLKVGFASEEWEEKGNVASVKHQVLSENNEKDKNNVSMHNTKYLIHNTIDILFVAFGFPKQERWIYENLKKIPVKAAIGVGGTFDYISGKVSRAPKAMQEVGFEWLFRLFIQPWRLKRQFALPKFIYLLLKEKIKQK